MKKLILILLLISAVSHAAEFKFSEGTDINIGITNGNIVPSANVPIYWGERFYSALGFNIFNTSESEKLSGFSESRNAINTKEMVLTLSPIGYRDTFSVFRYYLTLNYSYNKTDRTEFGYMHMPAYLGGDWVAFENDVAFDIHSVYLEAAIEYRTGGFLAKLTGKASPWQYMNLKQNTMMKPIVADDADFKTTSSGGGLSYGLSAEAGYKINRYIGIKADLKYEFLPLKYDLELLNYDAGSSAFYFEQEEVEEENRKIIYGAHLFIPIVDTAGLSPSIGYEIQEIYVKDKSTGSSSGSIEGLFKFGLTYNW